jgi:hypothetical protein
VIIVLIVVCMLALLVMAVVLLVMTIVVLVMMRLIPVWCGAVVFTPSVMVRASLFMVFGAASVVMLLIMMSFVPSVFALNSETSNNRHEYRPGFYHFQNKPNWPWQFFIVICDLSSRWCMLRAH